MLGSDYATNTWPGCGEIDIMEYKEGTHKMLWNTPLSSCFCQSWKYQFYYYKRCN
jgi:hypothetical protein